MTSSEALDPPDRDPDRAPLLRSTVLALAGSTVLLAIGAVLAVMWLWTVVRGQQRIGGSGFIGTGIGAPSGYPGPSFADRVDAVVQSTFLLAYSGILVGLGLGLRLFADSMASRLRQHAAAAPEASIGPDTI